MSEKKSKISSHINSTVLLLLAVSNTLLAHTQEDFFALPLEELPHVSVASLFDESVLVAGSSVHAMTENEWLANGARRSNDIMQFQPSSVPYLFLGGSHVLAMRGYANSLSARGVATMLDGVPLNTFSFGTAQYFLSNFDIGALQRAEIISGPGSSMYGSDAFHGVYSLSTFATDENTLQAELGAGTTDYARSYVRFSQALSAAHRIQGAVAATHEGDSEIRFATADPDVSGERQDAYRSKTAFIKSQQTIGKLWSAELAAYFNENRAEDFPSFGVAVLGEDDISDNQLSFYMVTAKAGYQYSDHTTIEFSSFFWNADQQFNYQFDPVPLQAQEDERYGAKAIIKHENSNSGLRWLLGAGVDRAAIVSAETIDGLQAFDGLERDIRNIFAQLRVPLYQQKVSAHLGARLDDYADFGSQFTPRISLVYMADEHSALKLLYGNAFRAPVGSELTSSGRIQGNPDLNPETIDSYELIWMQQKSNLSYSATLYKSQWKDGIIILDDASLPAPFEQRYVNQAELSAQGIELEAKVRLKQAVLNGSYAYTESENETADEDFVAFPRHIVQLGIEGENLLGVYVRLNNILYIDVAASPVQDAEKLPDIWNTNLHIGYAWSRKLSLSLDIRDILDRQDHLPSLWGNPQGLPAEGRQISAYLRYTF